MSFSNLDYVVLYVNDSQASAAFYAQLFGLTPVEQSPNWSLFRFPNGHMLGLWSRACTKPEASSEGDGCEICFMQEDVDGVYSDWVARGIRIALEPTAMNGMERTFVALDLDGHRIRVLRLKKNANG